MATAIVTRITTWLQRKYLSQLRRGSSAITDPKQTAQWWGQKDLYRLTNSHSDLRVGGKWFSEGVGGDGTKFRVEGEYLEIDPPRLLVHTEPELPKLAQHGGAMGTRSPRYARVAARRTSADGNRYHGEVASPGSPEIVALLNSTVKVEASARLDAGVRGKDVTVEAR
jgi:hypothetical protein